jgi:pimeloyl-ACP methyl ester carboxylesterase
MAHRWIDVGGLRLHCVEAGTGPLVVLLHGFPEFWYAWRHQIPALADAGYRVVAPDLRGYNTSDKPSRVRDYRPRVLVQDVADLIVALGAGSAAVAGHDWGGGLAWLLAMQHPKRVERLVLLNAPHPVRFLKGLRSPPAAPQLVHSGLSAPVAARAAGGGPGLPGAALDLAPPTDPAGRFHGPRHRPLRRRGRPARRPARRHQLLPGRLPRQPLAQAHGLRRVDIPTLIIWGDQDRSLGRELAEPDRAWVPDVGRADRRGQPLCKPTIRSGSTSS